MALALSLMVMRARCSGTVFARLLFLPHTRLKTSTTRAPPRNTTLCNTLCMCKLCKCDGSSGALARPPLPNSALCPHGVSSRVTGLSTAGESLWSNSAVKAGRPGLNCAPSDERRELRAGRRTRAEGLQGATEYSEYACSTAGHGHVPWGRYSASRAARRESALRRGRAAAGASAARAACSWAACRRRRGEAARAGCWR